MGFNCRYCVGGPILDAICHAWGYKAKLEESVTNQKNHQLPVSDFFLSLHILLFCSLLVATVPLFAVCN